MGLGAGAGETCGPGPGPQCPPRSGGGTGVTPELAHVDAFEKDRLVDVKETAA